MATKGRDPLSPEGWQAVTNHLKQLTREEWQELVDKYSHAPEGVYDPYSDENWPMEREFRYPTNGREPVTSQPPTEHPCEPPASE